MERLDFYGTDWEVAVFSKLYHRSVTIFIYNENDLQPIPMPTDVAHPKQVTLLFTGDRQEGH